MTRPDGLLFYGIYSLHLLWSERQSGRHDAGRKILQWVLVFAIVFVPYYLWRFSYYGYTFPNTFYAKVGGAPPVGRGLRYVGVYLLGYGGGILMLPALFVLRQLRQDWVKLLFAQIVIYGGYIIYVGGDGLAFERFIVPILPPLCVLAQEGMRSAYEWAKGLAAPAYGRAMAVAACGLTLGAAALSGLPSIGPILFPNRDRWYEPNSGLTFPGVGRDHRYLNFDNYFVERQRRAAMWLNANAPANSLIAATPAGSIAYYSSLRVIDMLGLNDVHIAHFGRKGEGWDRAGHEKGDGSYVLSRSPDFILLGNVAVLPAPIAESEMMSKLIRTSEHEIWADPGFHQKYELVTAKLGDDGIFKYFMFYKKKSINLVSPTIMTARTKEAE